jgi:galacturonosyltransferase WbtD
MHVTQKISNKKPEILIIDNSLKSFLNFRGQLLDKLSQHYAVEIATVVDLKNFDQEKNLKTYNLQMCRGSKSIRKLYSEVIKIAKIIRVKKPKIVLSFTLRCAVLSTLSALFTNKYKSVVVIAGLGTFFQNKNIINKFIQKLIIKIILKNDVVIVLNKEIYEVFKKGNPVLINGEGIDLKKFSYNQKSNIKNFIFIGRLLKDKGILELIQAFNIFSKTHANVTLTLLLSIDDQNPKQIDVQHIEKISNSRTDIIVNCENVEEKLREADCFVFPSYHEGFSIALSEAAACGLPLLVTNISGCRELVTNGNGLLIQPMSVESLVNGLDRIISFSSEEVKLMSQNSRNYALKRLDSRKQAKLFFDAII